ncbi:MAG: substrate-binding domain-containing protein [Opitutaceae bacterium]|nr:substrate-binding domain-containing protein [Opitutaceae bacterium]
MKNFSRLGGGLIAGLLLASGLPPLQAQPDASTGAAPQDLSDPAVQFVNTLPAYAPGEKVTGTIRLWGHGSHRRNFMGNLIKSWVDGFSNHQPEVKFENRMYGTASAIGALFTGAGNIALLGEEISPPAALAFQRDRGYAPTEIQVTPGSLDVNFFDYAHMIFVHQDNPIAGLTLTQLDAVFGAEHRRGPRNIRTWGGLGLTGAWADKRIQPYGWKVDEDFALFFRERVLQNSHRWNPEIKEYVHVLRPDGSQYDHGLQILDALAKDPYGIAISNVRYTVPGVRALPLAWREGEPFAAPTKANLISQKYPLVRIIPAYIDCAPGQPVEPAVREFLRYVLSREGQQALLKETGYLPLGKDAIREQLAKLGANAGAVSRQSADKAACSGPAPISANVRVSLPPATHRPSETRIIRIWGHPGMTALVERWREGFIKLHPDVRVEAKMTGSDIAMAGLYTAKADLALMCREAAAQEMKGFVWIYEYQPTRIEVMTGSFSQAGKADALVVYAHKDNPLTHLTLAQLDAIFGHERRRGAPADLRTWGDLGLAGEWKDRPIALYTYDTDAGTGRFFREAVLNDSRALKWEQITEYQGALKAGAGEKILAALAHDRFGLAVAGPGATSQEVKPIAIAAADGNPFVLATRETVASREYPLARPVLAYLNRAPGKPADPLLAEFLRYILGPEGRQAITPGDGFLPLTPANTAAQLKKLE